MSQHKDYSGLTDKQVEESRKLYGDNLLTPPDKTPIWKLFLEKFDDPIIKILLAACVLSTIIAGVHYAGMEQKDFTPFLEPIGIFFAVLLSTCIGFFFEMKASKAFDLLNTSNDDVASHVFRNNHLTEIARKDIVVGDVIVLKTGDEVPADGELLDAISMQVNESALTGEPLADKTINEAYFDDEATYPSNEVMRGTSVINGHGVMRVKTVGDNTAYGKVYEGSQIENNIDTPLQQQLKKLAGIISKAGYAVAVLTFAALCSKIFMENGTNFTLDVINELLHAFMIAVTLIVMAVPEGLPMSVTLSLALSMNRMLKTNNLVRKMHACETMGAATVICTDKTGTLTENRMQVSQTKFFALGDNQELTDSPLSHIITEGISANSTAFLDIYGQAPDEVKPLGNPTESALLIWMHKHRISYAEHRSKVTIVDQLTFTTENKYMATIVDSALLNKRMLYLKGAPEIIMSMCKDIHLGTTTAPIAQEEANILKQLQHYQEQAMRTLGFAYIELEPGDTTNYFETGKLQGITPTFLGIAAIADPVRKDVPQAVGTCLKAGIDVKIVTGDTLITAREIGRQIGIWDNSSNQEQQIITGPDFEKLSDQEALERIADLKIMCRARPTDKQRLVKLLQQQDEVVAVTGDGTNDAPALNAAQVGLSMGDGTAVAKEVSDITILDNSFSSITQAVMWGRSLYRNIQRFLLFQLTINVVACLIVLISTMLGMETPLTITQILWVNLIMDTFAAGALASLPPNASVMQSKPRKGGKGGDFIIPKSMAIQIFSVGIIFVLGLLALLFHLQTEGEFTRYELSYFFTVFVMLQFWNLFNAKAYLESKSAFAGMTKSKGFVMVSLLIVGLQYMIVTYGGEMFSVVPLEAKDWGIIIASTSIVLWVGEIARFAKKKK